MQKIIVSIAFVICAPLLFSGCTGVAGAAFGGGMFLADKEMDKSKTKRELADEKSRYLAREHAKWQMDRVQLERMKQELGFDGVILSDLNSRLISGELTRIVAINARSINGVVTLSGNVPSEAMKEKAIRIARSVRGVKQVVSDLQVKEVRIKSRYFPPKKKPKDVDVGPSVFQR